MWPQALSCLYNCRSPSSSLTRTLTQGMSCVPRTPSFKAFQSADPVLPSSTGRIPFPSPSFSSLSSSSFIPLSIQALQPSTFHSIASLCFLKEWSSALAKEQSSFTKEDCWKQSSPGQLGTALITPNMILQVHVTTILLNSSNPFPLPGWSLAVYDRANCSGDNYSWAQLHS